LPDVGDRRPSANPCTARYEVGCPCDVIAWNAVRVTRASLDKQPHDVAAMFDQVADRYDRSNDVLAAHVAASGEVCRALPTVLELELQAHERLVVDGAWLLPSFVTELELPDTEARAVYRPAHRG
jgi:hypothetical protein